MIYEAICHITILNLCFSVCLLAYCLSVYHASLSFSAKSRSIYQSLNRVTSGLSSVALKSDYQEIQKSTNCTIRAFTDNTEKNRPVRQKEKQDQFFVCSITVATFMKHFICGNKLLQYLFPNGTSACISNLIKLLETTPYYLTIQNRSVRSCQSTCKNLLPHNHKWYKLQPQRVDRNQTRDPIM